MPQRILHQAHVHRRAAASLIYAGIAVAGVALAYLARFDFQPEVLASSAFAIVAGLVVVVRLGTNYAFRLTTSRWRYVSTQDFRRLLAAVSVGSAVLLLVTMAVPGLPRIPRSVLLLEWVFNGYLTGGTWLVYRLVFEHLRVAGGAERRRVLVVGAGEAGQLLVAQMLRSGSGLRPVGFVDDDPFKWGTLLHGVEVVGAVRDVLAISQAMEADEILIAVPSATAAELRLILEACEGAQAAIKILPGIEKVLAGEASLNLVRDVRVEDLLGREPVRMQLPELAAELAGTTVLVTGAAGSIGSELVRQVALHHPAHLVLLDQAETPLYYLELEVRKRHPELRLTAVVGSVTDRDTVRRTIREHGPRHVFHAAAYKHVPMMEHHPREAVRVNVLGTYNVAWEAGTGGAEKFLLISTDKAVRPSNVMGASKQLAERLCLQLQEVHPRTEYRAVRFGNVLGSNGSVIPLFRRQLEAGEPLTVTHEEITRFFMTIPEAVQLVLKASTLPECRGLVAMLDMGEPVRILDLARNLLRLAGRPFRLGETVVVTGLRPGEKLHEELVAPDERVWETTLDRVSIVETAPGYATLPPDVLARLDEGDVDRVADFFMAESGLFEGAGTPHSPGLRIL